MYLHKVFIINRNYDQKRFRNEHKGRKNTALPDTVKHILLTEKRMHIKKATVDKK